MKMPLDIFSSLRDKFPTTDFFELYEKRDRIVKKLPNLSKVRETEYTLSKYRKIDSIVLREKIELLLKTLEEKKYYKTELIEEIREILKNEDMRYYSQQQYFNFCYSDDFHNIFFFYYDDSYINKIKKYKKWTFDRSYAIGCLLESIRRKSNSKKREKEYYSRIRQFRKMKKQVFTLEVAFVRVDYTFDWACSSDEKVLVTISDINKDTVLRRITEDGNTVTRIIKSLCKQNCSVGYVKSINFLDANKHSKNKEKRNDYEKWNCFEKEVHALRLLD